MDGDVFVVVGVVVIVKWEGVVFVMMMWGWGDGGDCENVCC